MAASVGHTGLLLLLQGRCEMAADEALELGIIGLGRIGGNLARQAVEKGMRAVGFDVRGASADLAASGVELVGDLGSLCRLLSPARLVLAYVPAGPVVDTLIQGLMPHLKPGDVIADGGNSYWGDSMLRRQRLAPSGVEFVDVGTSGGMEGARHGACFMVGGEDKAVAKMEPVLRRLAVPGGYVHAGPPGAGHYAKLVHNGIEFGMLEAIGEGIDLLENYRDKLDVGAILRAWRNGSVIRSWLIELMAEAYGSGADFETVPAYIEDTGEVNWLVGDALHMEVPIPVIAEAVMQLIISRDERKNWARVIAMIRHAFGGHPFGPDEATARERQEGRIAGFPRKSLPP